MAAITLSDGLAKTCSLLCTSLILDIPIMINWHLSKQRIRWPVSRDHIAGSSLQLFEVKCFFEVVRWLIAGFSIGSPAHVWLTCWKQGRIVRKPVNANPWLKFNRIFFYTNVFAALFCVYGDYWNPKPKAKQYTENLSAKLQTQIKILLFPGLKA